MSAPRRLIASFVLLLILPAAAVVWLGTRLVAQDRELEARQLEERRNSAADRAVAELEQALSASERRLQSHDMLRDSDDAVMLSIRGARVEAQPAQRLLYYPQALSAPGPTDVFTAAETLEFRDGDYSRAAAAFRELAASRSPHVRAGALLRLARNLRRLNRRDEAKTVYRELSRIEGVTLDGVPADLLARRALLDLGSDTPSQKDALAGDLLAGRWRLDRATFFAYLGDHPVPPEREALAEAAAWVAQVAEASGRRALTISGTPILVLWQTGSGLRSALAAGPRFQAREWFDALEPSIALALPNGTAVFGALQPDAAAARRPAVETGLPWTVVASTPAGAADALGFARRRATLLWGLALLIGLVFAGGWFTLRAVSRELALARLQSDFVSSVSHEFRTPLTSMRQFTHLLVEDDNLPGEKRRSFYRAQERATERLHRLVETLLDFGRMEAGRHPYQRVRLPVAPLVRGVVEDFRREATPLGFTIEASIREDAGEIDADADAIARALWNLMDNAVKYSGDSRTVWVDVQRESGSVAIRVRDRGLGIPVDEHGTIFQKFVRGREVRARSVRGTGIGLAMVRHIVDGHHGTITLESAPGHGSAFTLFVPVSD
jgi:signal transduction histidine kinase